MYYSDFSSGFGKKDAVRVLILINIAVFIIINVFRQFPWEMYLGLVPAFVFSRMMIWQFVSYLFVHAGIWHLALNMLMLWMFGSVIESTWGSRRFLGYYFFTGIGAGICSVVFAHNAVYPVVGASGAIFGLLVAFGMMFPESVILLFLIFPMKMKYAVLVLGGINLLGALSDTGGGVAYVAHLGGAVFGYFYLKNERLRMAFSSLSLKNIKQDLREKQSMRLEKQRQVIDAKVDEILDKISARGMASLTDTEKKILKQKSKL